MLMYIIIVMVIVSVCAGNLETVTVAPPHRLHTRVATPGIGKIRECE